MIDIDAKSKKNNATAAHPTQQGRVRELDGIRGLAILLILFWHYGQNALPADTILPARLARALSFTWSGVDLFFVLSGFLICGILLDNRDSKRYFSTFYLRRFFRIIPLYWLWILLYVIVTRIDLVPYMGFNAYYALTQPNLPASYYLTFTQNIWMADYGAFTSHWIDVTWSLAIEEQFYLILPLIVKIVPRRWLPLAFGLAIVGAFATRVYYVQQYDIAAGMKNYVSLVTRADALFAGALMAYWVRSPKMQAFMSARAWFWPSIFGVGFAGVAWLMWSGRSYLGTSSMLPWAYTAFMLMYGGLIGMTISRRFGLLTKVFSWEPLCQLGIYAYGLYMTHQAVNGLVHGFIRQQPPIFADATDVLPTLLSCILVWFLSKFLWRYFEQPFIKIGYRFKY